MRPPICIFFDPPMLIVESLRRPAWMHAKAQNYYFHSYFRYTHSIFRLWQKRNINLEKPKQQPSREAYHFLFWGLQLGRGFGFSSSSNKLCWLDHALRVQSLAHLEHGPSCPYSVPCGIKPFIRDLPCRFSVPAMKNASHVGQPFDSLSWQYTHTHTHTETEKDSIK